MLSKVAEVKKSCTFRICT
uniref:Uncharacterized protein n=1 Tax=Rhizophora mucronata TaxID=61149 RepID=A0A2P2QMV9_RHIMU